MPDRRHRSEGLVLPGGVANPDLLRTDPDAVAFTREFFAQAKPVAVICHGPWTLVEADVVNGRTAFCAKLVDEMAEGEHEAQARSVGATP